MLKPFFLPFRKSFLPARARQTRASAAIAVFCVSAFSATNSLGSAPPPAATLAYKDTYALSEKLKKSLRHCAPLKDRPNVAVELKNVTGEALDESRLKELLRSMLEERTHRFPEQPNATLSVHALLTVQERKIASLYRTEYKLSAVVFRGSEALCQASAKLKKIARAPRKGAEEAPTQ